jgi:hypothetical protein
MSAVIRTQVQLTEEQLRRLKRLAADRDVSIAELVRNGVDTILDTAESGSQTDRARRALAALGRFRSGRFDVAREHDRYLAEAYVGGGICWGRHMHTAVRMSDERLRRHFRAVRGARCGGRRSCSGAELLDRTDSTPRGHCSPPTMSVSRARLCCRPGWAWMRCA